MVSRVGNAMLLHKNDVRDDYLWVQYDQYSNSLQFITEDGDMHFLGFDLDAGMQEPLLNTKELLMVQIGEDMKPCDFKIIKFSGYAG